MKAKYYTIPIAVFVLCSIVAMVVRFTVSNKDSNIMEYMISLSGSFDEIKGSDNDATLPSTVNEIDDMAELVVRAKFERDRIVSEKGLYSKVIIQEVYKGNQDLTGKQLYIVEEMSVFPETKYLNLHGMYVPLQEGDEYLLLLKKVNFRAERNLTEMQKYEYYPVTQSQLSAYRITKEKQETAFTEEDQITLNQMDGLDVATRKQSDLTLYYQFRDEMFQKYNITGVNE